MAPSAIGTKAPSIHRGGYKQINKALNICAFEDYLETQIAHLPALPDIEQITPRVLRVLGQNAGKFTLQGTNTYIIGTGSKRLIIDTAQGLPEWAALISTALAQRGISLSHVLLTHWHGDHTGGVPDLVRMYPYLADAIYKHTPGKGQKAVEDGQVFCVEGATVRAVHAPGHSTDHMCFVIEEENAMFTGDNVLGHGTAAVEKLGTWMSSLRVMQSHRCDVGYPAHGEVIAKLPAKISLELSQKSRREEQVLRVLARLKQTRKESGNRKGSVSVRQLVEEMHGSGVNKQVAEMALIPFMDEVLRKLAEDGKVAFEIKTGEKRWFTLQMLEAP